MYRTIEHHPILDHMRSKCACLGLLAISLAAGCATTPPTSDSNPDAPLVTSAIEAAAAVRGYTSADIRAGRNFFIARCDECHELHEPGSRTEDDWKDVLPTMTRRAKLSKDDARRVQAYILSAMDTAAKTPEPTGTEMDR